MILALFTGFLTLLLGLIPMPVPSTLPDSEATAGDLKTVALVYSRTITVDHGVHVRRPFSN